MNGRPLVARSRASIVVAIVTAAAVAFPGAAAFADASGHVLADAHPDADSTAYTGLTSDAAAASCWEIKQQHPDQPSGAYWLVTPSMAEPAQFWCDQETDGGGWVKVGAGRETWETLAVGRGNPETLLTGTPAANAVTTQLPAETVDGLLDGAPVSALTDGIRVRRAANTTGTDWQEVRFEPTKAVGWSWSMGAGWPLDRWRVGTATGTGGSTTRFGSWISSLVVDTSIGRDLKYTWSFSYGRGVTGLSADTSYLWTPRDGQGGARPFSEVYVRPRLINPEVTFPTIADAGTAKVEKEAVPNSLALVNGWGVTGLAGPVDREGDVEVQAMVEAGGRMYVGGNFRYVQQDAVGTGQVEQSFLAAFDAITGEYIPTFTPTFDNAVQSLAALPDGRIAVGGKFTTVNGTAVTGLTVLDPTTGEVSPGWGATMINNVSPGLVRVLVLTVSDGYLYVGGAFTHTTGQTGAPVYARNAVRLDADTGKPDITWRPEFNGSVQDAEISEDGTKVYMAGWFDSMAGATATSAAALLTSSPAQLDPTRWNPVWSSLNDYQQAVEQVGDRVYVGGSEHGLFSFDTSSYDRLTTQINDPKGDTQVAVAAGNFLFAGSHSNNYTYTGATQWPLFGTSWSRADTIGWVGAWRLDDVSVVSTFTPTIRARLGSGAWAVAEGPNGDVWVGGDFVSARSTGNVARWSGGFVRFQLTDATAPNSPSDFRVVSQDETTVALAWSASPGGLDGGHYQIIRDDRVIATTDSTSITVPTGGANRFFVRASDSTGNLSASTEVLAVLEGNSTPVAQISSVVDGLDVSFDGGGSTDSDGTIASYAWDFGDGSAAGSGVTASHTYAAAGDYTVTLTTTDDLGATGSASATVTVTEPGAAAGSTPVTMDASWAWWYQTAAPAAGWNTVGFDTTSWNTGGATLGFGSALIETNIDTFATKTDRARTAYFVKSFEVDNASEVVSLTLDTVANDGVVVYVNGTEVGRKNMPTGTITHFTFASGARNITVADADPFVIDVPTSLLVNGTNVIAAETHLNYRRTRDFSFRLEATMLAH